MQVETAIDADEKRVALHFDIGDAKHQQPGILDQINAGLNGYFDRAAREIED